MGTLSHERTKEMISEYLDHVTPLVYVPSRISKPLLYVIPEEYKHHYQQWEMIPSYAIIFPEIEFEQTFGMEARIWYRSEVWYVGIRDWDLKRVLVRVSHPGIQYKEKSLNVSDAFVIEHSREAFPFPEPEEEGLNDT
jgi:hypothetical protein